MNIKLLILTVLLCGLATLNTGCYAIIHKPTKVQTIEIRSNPSGAYIWLLDTDLASPTYLGTTPLRISLDPKFMAFRKIHFCKEGYYPVSMMIVDMENDPFIPFLFDTFLLIPLLFDMIIYPDLSTFRWYFTQDIYEKKLTPITDPPPTNRTVLTSGKPLYEQYPCLLDLSLPRTWKMLQQNTPEQLQQMHATLEILQAQQQAQMQAIQQLNQQPLIPSQPNQNTQIVPTLQPVQPMPVQPNIPARPSVNRSTSPRTNSPSFKRVCPKHGEYDMRAGGCPGCIAPKW